MDTTGKLYASLFPSSYFVFIANKMRGIICTSGIYENYTWISFF